MFSHTMSMNAVQIFHIPAITQKNFNILEYPVYIRMPQDPQAQNNATEVIHLPIHL